MRKRINAILFVILLLGVVVTGCSSKSAQSPESRGDMAKSEMAVENGIRDSAESPQMAEEIGFGGGNTSRKNQNQKLIYRASMSVEVTQGLEPLVGSLQNFIESHNGYIENMEQYRHGYDPITQEQLEGISMRIRIPHEHYNKTIQTISELGVVVNKGSSVEDVTLQYSDIESTLKMYKIEQDRLLEMLQNKTTDVKDMIEIEKRLSEVRVEIEKQESARRALESQIDYDTIDLEISQVRRTSPSNETKSFGARIQSTFIKSIDEVVIFMQNLVLSFTYMLIPLIILTIIGGLIFLVISKFSKITRKKKSQLPPASDKDDK